MSYQPYNVKLSTNMKGKVQNAIQHSKPLMIRLSKDALVGDNTLLLTRGQISSIERAKDIGKGVSIKLSKRQLKSNLEHKGGFLSLLAGLAARALPALLGGVTTGLISGGIEKAIAGRGIGDGLFLHKGGHCYQVHKTEGEGLFLSPHERLRHVSGDGLFLRHGKNIYDGKGLLFGENSPFKNIPLLNLIL